MFNRSSQFRSILYRRCWKEMMLERAEQEERERFQKIKELEFRLDKLIDRERLRKIEELEARLDEISAIIQNESFSYKEQEDVYETYDELWNNDDEGMIEEMELELPDYTELSEDVVVEPLDQMEDDEKKEHLPSWDDEFGDELVGLPVFDEHAEFDPVGDLIYLETLIMGKPTMEIKTSSEEEKEEDVATEEDQNMVVVESPHHRNVSKFVEELDSGSPPKSTNPQKRERKHVLRVQKCNVVLSFHNTRGVPKLTNDAKPNVRIGSYGIVDTRTTDKCQHPTEYILVSKVCVVCHMEAWEYPVPVVVVVVHQREDLDPFYQQLNCINKPENQ
ncbi:uncharacterized protein LOC143538812 [Bidens hawaiensis]|uniref:uncharacterized protein LOC143538812 n=1 Tax=Bidens hawaiensis TaxID=980011 RepID=UPI004049EB52